MADITDLIEYYVNLLIIQYSGPNSPNAQAEIALLAETMLASGIFLDLQNAYSLGTDSTDSAVGEQLDVLGKYAGVDRFYSELDLVNYSAMVNYTQAGSLPTSPPAYGLTTYANYSNYDQNGTLQYDEIIATNNMLNDTAFLILIQLAIIKNNSNFSDAQIDNALFQFFGDSLRAEDVGGMSMVFFVNANVSPVIQAVIAKGLLPIPMAVGAEIVENITGLMFALTTYGGTPSPFGYGFSTYSNYASLAGQTLTYSQIVAV